MAGMLVCRCGWRESKCVSVCVARMRCVYWRYRCVCVCGEDVALSVCVDWLK